MITSILGSLASAATPSVAATTSLLEKGFIDLQRYVPLINAAPAARAPAPAQPDAEGRVFESLPVGSGPAGMPPGTPPPSGPGGPPGGSPPIDLRDMTLPPDVLNLVTPILSTLRMRIEQRELSNRITKNARVHFARNGSFSTYVLHFQAQVLTNAERASEVTSYGYLFRAGDHVRIVSKDCSDPEESYELGWQQWVDAGVDTKYVEWRYIAKLAKAAEARRPDLLKLAFGLPEPKTQTVANLADDSVRVGQLADLLAKTGLASTQAVNDWFNDRLKTLPQGMQLERSDWGKAFPPAARALVDFLITKGEHPGRAGYSCLAAVLIDLAPQLGVPGRNLVVDLLSSYQLVTPDDALQAAIKQVKDA